MGYTLTFKGVTNRRLRPGRRCSSRSRIRTAAPTSPALDVSQRKDEPDGGQPDVHVQLTHDVYVSPIEFDPGRLPEHGDSWTSAGPDRQDRPLEITFDGFEMAGKHSETGKVSSAFPVKSATLGHAAAVEPVTEGAHAPCSHDAG